MNILAARAKQETHHFEDIFGVSPIRFYANPRTERELREELTRQMAYISPAIRLMLLTTAPLYLVAPTSLRWIVLLIYHRNRSFPSWRHALVRSSPFCLGAGTTA